jgi:hypothetical protein
VLGWRSRVRRLGVKTAPGLDHDALPADVEVEVVSVGGDVKEAVLWTGEARTGARRSASLLPGGHVLTSVAVADPRVTEPGAFLLEPDGAVIRAHLVQQLAAQVDGRLLDPTIAYLTADAATPTPFGRWYAVREVLPFSLKGLRARLRELDAGTLVVKKRGTCRRAGGAAPAAPAHRQPGDHDRADPHVGAAGGAGGRAATGRSRAAGRARDRHCCPRRAARRPRS